MKKIAFLSFAFCFLSSVSAFAQDYYVMPSGSDSNTGLAGSPFRTISHAAQTVPANATVNITPAVYYETTEVYINKPMVLRKNGTGEVVIDASMRSAITPNKFVIGVINTSNVVVDGIKIQNCTMNEWKGIWVFNSNISTVTAQNIAIRNCTITNVGWISNNLTAIPADTNVATIPLKVEGGNALPLSNIYITNNTVYNCATGYGEGITVTGNVDGFTVSGNTVYDIANIGIDIAGNYNNTTAPAAVNKARNGIVEKNTVHHCMSAKAIAAGIYLDGCKNVVVRYNKLHQNGVGLSLGGEAPATSLIGEDTIHNNLIYNNAFAGAILGTNNANIVHVLKDVRMYNNVFYKNRTGENINGVTTLNGESVTTKASLTGGEIMLQNSDRLTLQNNIIYPLPGIGKLGIIALYDYTVSNYSSDYNLFYQNAGSPLIQIGTGTISFNGSNTWGRDYFTLSDFTSTTGGLEQNSKVGDPLFVNPSTYNFALSLLSPAIDMGGAYNARFSGDYDIAGNTRRMGDSIDAGAYESNFLPGNVGNTSVATKISVFPNPTTDVCFVQLPEYADKIQVVLTDVTGRQISRISKDKVAAGSFIAYSVVGIPKGIYMLTVYTERNLYTATITVQ